MSGKKKHQNVKSKTSPDGWIKKIQPGYGNPLPDHHTIMTGPFVVAGMRHVTTSKSANLNPDSKEKSTSIVSPPKSKRVFNPYVVKSKKNRTALAKEGAVHNVDSAKKRKRIP